MDEEMQKLCEDYAWAWYFDHEHRLEAQNAWLKKRCEFPSNIKNEISEYFEMCRKKNEELIPYTDHIGWMQLKLINLKEE